MVERSDIFFSAGSLLVICGFSLALLNLDYISFVELGPVILVLFGSWCFLFASILALGRFPRFSSRPSDVGLLALFLVFGGYLSLLYVQGLTSEFWLASLFVGFCGAMIILLEFRRHD